MNDDKPEVVIMLPLPTNGSTMPDEQRTFRDEDTVNLRTRQVRPTETLTKELVKSAGAMGDQFLDLKAQVAGFRRLLYGTLIVALLALVSAGSVLVAGRRGPSSAEVTKMLEKVAAPLERLERVLDRLDRKLDRIEK